MKRILRFSLRAFAVTLAIGSGALGVASVHQSSRSLRPLRTRAGRATFRQAVMR